MLCTCWEMQNNVNHNHKPGRYILQSHGVLSTCSVTVLMCSINVLNHAVHHEFSLKLLPPWTDSCWEQINTSKSNQRAHRQTPGPKSTFNIGPDLRQTIEGRRRGTSVRVDSIFWSLGRCWWLRLVFDFKDFFWTFFWKKIKIKTVMKVQALLQL